jgi:hypothetical protein
MISDLQKYLTVALAIAIVGISYYFLLLPANERIESRCAASGGYVLIRPGSISQCLRSAR